MNFGNSSNTQLNHLVYFYANREGLIVPIGVHIQSGDHIINDAVRFRLAPPLLKIPYFKGFLDSFLAK